MRTLKHEALTLAIESEVTQAARLIETANYEAAYHRLERAHVLGQSSTFEHTRIHWQMLKLAFRMRSAREIGGQIIRILGAFTKTPFGIYPVGNTGGANVWFFKSLPVPNDLKEILDKPNPRTQ